MHRFVVIKSTYHHEVMRVEQETPKKLVGATLFPNGRNYSLNRHVLKSEVVFEGTEAQCQLLVERIMSSENVAKQEVLRVRQREAARLVKLIERAKRDAQAEV